MNRIHNTFYLILIGISFAGSPPDAGGGGWLDKWLTVEFGLLLWTIVTFLVLLFILRWKAWGPLMNALDVRAQQIEESLNQAEKIIEDQAQSAKDNEQILDKAREEASQIIAEAKDAGENLKNKLSEEGQEKYDTLISNAKADIESAKDQALNDIKTMVVEIALDASEKIIKRNLNNEDNKNIIEKTVKSFQEKN